MEESEESFRTELDTAFDIRTVLHMAQRVQIIMEDDLDGSEATETVVFAIDGVTYELDLNEKNAAKIRKAFEPFVSKGRRVSGRSNGKSKASAKSTGPKPADVREWAQSNGFVVPARGRIPADVQDAYAAAH